MKLAVTGSGRDAKCDPKVIEIAKEVGKEIARNNAVLVTGGCPGYPYAAVKGAKELDGKTISISPASSEEEHKNKYNFPTDHTETIYTGNGIPGRNIDLVNYADAMIFIGGEIGTLQEFTFAVYKRIPLGILKGSGGVSDIIPNIMDVASAYKDRKIIYESDPKILIKKIMV